MILSDQSATRRCSPSEPSATNSVQEPCASRPLKFAPEPASKSSAPPMLLPGAVAVIVLRPNCKVSPEMLTGNPGRHPSGLAEKILSMPLAAVSLPSSFAPNRLSRVVLQRAHLEDDPPSRSR